MYFPIGWPKVIKIPELGQTKLKQIVCNRDKILFAILTDDSLSIWFCKVSKQKKHCANSESLELLALCLDCVSPPQSRIVE